MAAVAPTPQARKNESLHGIPSHPHSQAQSKGTKTPLPPLFSEKIKSSLPPTIRRSLIIPSFQRKETIPIIHPSEQSGYDSGAGTGAEDAYIRFEKIIQLLTGKYTRNVYDRHAAVLDKLAKIYSSGVVLLDAKQLSTVLDLIYERIQEEGGEVILPSLTKLVHCFATPIELQQIELREKEAIQKNTICLLETLSSLVKLDDEELTEYACNGIYMLTGGPDSTEDNGHVHRLNLATFSLNESTPLPEVNSSANSEDIHKQTKKLLLEAGEKSSMVITNLTEALQKTESESNILAILRCLRWLSKSPISCSNLVNAKTFQVIQHIMTAHTRSIKFFGLELLWNGLESPIPQSQDVAEILCSPEVLSNLKVMFDEITIHAKRQDEFQMRNEFLVLFIKIATLAPHILEMFRVTDLIDSITLFLTHAELNLDHPAVQHWSLTDTFYDFEFKRLLITLSSKLTIESKNLEVFLQDGLFQFMMTYLHPTPENPGVKRWRPTQLRTLQIQIISLLNQIVPKAAKEFRSLDGYVTLSQFLRHIIDQGKAPETARVDIAREHISLLKGTLAFTLTLTELGPTSKKVLSASGIFENLIKLLMDDKQPSMIWTMCLVTCSSLCQGYKANKIAFGEANGVSAVIKYLKFSSADPQERETLLLTTVECIWGSVCGNMTNEDQFFTQGGIFLLLDLLELASSNMKKHILGCLLDLCENPKPIYHLLQWKTKKNIERGIEHLLIDIWNEEEALLGVENASDESVILQKNKSPLQGKNMKVVDLCKDGCEPGGGRAIHELSENLRAKVYSMFCKLGFERFSDSLTTQEKVKLTLISKYLDFKIGEVWAEISGELSFEGIRPVSPDLDCLNTIRDVMNKKAEGVQQRQLEQLRKFADAKKQEESQFYHHFLESVHVQDPKQVHPPKHAFHSWKLPNH